jgi:hypothetical protein
MTLIKYSMGIISVVFILFLISCDSTVQPVKPNQFPVNIIYESGYSHTKVRTSIDGTLFSVDTISTNLSLGLAKVIDTILLVGTHRLAITVNDSSSIDTSFQVSDSLNIGISFIPDSAKFNIRSGKGPWIYM